MARRKAPQPIRAEQSQYVDALAPQTPMGSEGSESPRSGSPFGLPQHAMPVSPWLLWAVSPLDSFKLLMVPIVLYVNWELITPRVAPGTPNPFAHFFLLSGRIPNSSEQDPRYQKTYFDLLFVAYFVVFFCMFRQTITVSISQPLGRFFGLRKHAKLERFGEQVYAVVYFTLSGLWGVRIMMQLPTYWYNPAAFWIDYPHWDMKPELKCYYLIQSANWLQQLLVMLLGLEKPRKDYYELVAHHIVTLWLIGWSYLVNLTLIGNAVYVSMDIPDVLLAFSKILNYLQYNREKVYSFGVFLVGWTYFRHYLNIVMLISVVRDFGLLPPEGMQWNPPTGAWLAPWMRWQIFTPLFLLQGINLFWYYAMIRILVKALTSSDLTDDRSDDEDDGDDEHEKED